MNDYMESYMTEKGFDLPSLINDDFFEAIKLLFNNGHFPSAMKLLLSFVDTIAFIEFGDSGGTYFKQWLTRHTDLTPVGVSVAELWELRNALLHMTNLHSRKVKSGAVQRLVAYVGHPPPDHQKYKEAKYFNLLALIHTIIAGIESFCIGLANNPQRMGEFMERYDLIVSDKRVIKTDAT
jgi:hypothetical protein